MFLRCSQKRWHQPSFCCGRRHAEWREGGVAGGVGASRITGEPVLSEPKSLEHPMVSPTHMEMHVLIDSGVWNHVPPLKGKLVAGTKPLFFFLSKTNAQGEVDTYRAHLGTLGKRLRCNDSCSLTPNVENAKMLLAVTAVKEGR